MTSAAGQVLYSIYWNVPCGRNGIYTKEGKEMIDSRLAVMERYFVDISSLNENYRNWSNHITLHALSRSSEQVSAFLLSVEDHSDLHIIKDEIL